MTQAEEITLTIPASEIVDLEAFEGSRLQAYKSGGRAFLTGLAENSRSVNGQCLYDQFESILDEDNSETESESKAQVIAGLATGSVFYDLVLGVDAEIHDIFRRVIIPEDENLTERRRRMASLVPFGRKQNGSCFVHRPLTGARRDI